MSELLAIFEDPAQDERLLAEVAARHPSAVWVLLAGGEPELADAQERDRLAHLLAEVEAATGATVTGLAGDRAVLEGREFDHEVRAALALAA